MVTEKKHIEIQYHQHFSIITFSVVPISKLDKNSFLSCSSKKLTMHIVYYLILEKGKFMINMDLWVSI